ncbi:tetratricopeptide repeat protein [uncultured Dokdonia sp.]|uniref:tetratricopeptide repeat protein n=1 Tax=uncultured Dokdonia sp. TaxID=575653 RepID=UPI002612FA7B|nr:tetratricopeptide repeat protein [uncultured Dokdonia sp.]
MDKDLLIQKYLKGTLSESEELLFQEYLEKDPSFAKDIPFYEGLHYAFAKADYEQTKSQLQSFYKEEKQSVWRKWSIAATILVLMGLGSLWFLNTINSTETLYAHYFEPYKNVVQPTVRGETIKTTKVLAFMAYDDGDYDTAIVHINELLEDKPEAILALYKANAQLQIDQTEAAIETLKSQIKKTDTIYAEAQWYLALSYLKLDNKEAAKSYLNTLLQTNSSFKNKDATALLKSLE